MVLQQKHQVSRPWDLLEELNGTASSRKLVQNVPGVSALVSPLAFYTDWSHRISYQQVFSLSQHQRHRKHLQKLEKVTYPARRSLEMLLAYQETWEDHVWRSSKERWADFPSQDLWSVHSWTLIKEALHWVHSLHLQNLGDRIASQTRRHYLCHLVRL